MTSYAEPLLDLAIPAWRPWYIAHDGLLALLSASADLIADVKPPDTERAWSALTRHCRANSKTRGSDPLPGPMQQWVTAHAPLVESVAAALRGARAHGGSPAIVIEPVVHRDSVKPLAVSGFVLALPVHMPSTVPQSVATPVAHAIRSLGQLLTNQIRRTGSFYQQHAADVSSAAATCVEAAKLVRHQTDRQRSTYAAACDETCLAIDMLRSFRDVNLAIVRSVLRAIPRVLGCHIMYSTSIEPMMARLPFSPQRQVSGLARLQQLVQQARQRAYPEVPSRFNAADTLSPTTGSRRRSALATRGPPLRPPTPWLRELAAVAAVLVVMVAVEYACLGQPIDVDGRAWDASYHFTLAATPVLLSTMFACCAFAWEHANVNYVFLFGLDPSDHWHPPELLRNSLVFGVALLGCMYGFVKTASVEQRRREAGEGPPVAFAVAWAYAVWGVYALLLVVFLLASLRPRKASQRPRPWWLLPSLWRIVRSPWLPVSFTDFIICACLVTGSDAWTQLQYLWCHIGVDDVAGDCAIARRVKVQALRLLPLAWRMLQCFRNHHDAPSPRTFFPHMVNAIKYIVAITALLTRFMLQMIVYSLPAGHPGRTAALVIYFVTRSCDGVYRYTWDVSVDCGLKPYRDEVVGGGNVAAPEALGADFESHRHSNENAAARRRSQLFSICWRVRPLLFPTWFYILFLGFDLLSRFSWLLWYFIDDELFNRPRWLPITIVVAAVLRRGLWVAVRVENEQVNNIELYKVSQQAPPPPVPLHRFLSDNTTAPVEMVPLTEPIEAEPTAAAAASSREDEAAAAEHRQRGQQQQRPPGGEEEEGGDGLFPQTTLSGVWDARANKFTLLDVDVAAAAINEVDEEELASPVAAPNVACEARTVDVGEGSDSGDNLGATAAGNFSFSSFARPSSMERFFHSLPGEERLAIVRIAASGEPLTDDLNDAARTPRFTSRHGTGKTRFFVALPAELQVHALLTHVGDRSLRAYMAHIIEQRRARHGRQPLPQ